MKTVGLFFGSFNPIHTGHLILADYFANQTHLDEVWLVVSPQNPFKEKKSLLDQYLRYDLVYRAIADNPKLKVSDIEFHLPQPSYTIHTLVYLEEKFPDRKFELILGEDNLNSFHKWKNFEQILKHYPLNIYPRYNNEAPSKLGDYPSVKIAEAPKIEISSSMIRQFIKEKRSVRYLLPDSIHNYVIDQNYYH